MSNENKKFAEVKKPTSAIYFWIATIVFMLPGLYVAHNFRSISTGDQLEALLWNFAPVLIAIVLFVSRAKAAAWGWLVAVGVATYIVLIAVTLSSRPTASLALFWAPVWNVVLIGPLGLAIGVLVKKVRNWG
jgi:hypothetical protein